MTYLSSIVSYSQISQTTSPSTSCWKICYMLREIRAKFLAPWTAANLNELLRFFDFDC